MKQLAFCFALGLAATVSVVALAQTQTPDATAPTTPAAVVPVPAAPAAADDAAAKPKTPPKGRAMPKAGMAKDDTAKGGTAKGGMKAADRKQQYGLPPMTAAEKRDKAKLDHDMKICIGC